VDLRRAGHSSSDRSNDQEPAARAVAELGLGDFTILDGAIPELAGKGGSVAGDGPAPEKPEVRATSNEVSRASAPPRRRVRRWPDAAALPEVDDEAAEGRRLGPRWVTPEEDPAEGQADVEKQEDWRRSRGGSLRRPAQLESMLSTTAFADRRRGALPSSPWDRCIGG
jgi:hypothetical protein